LVEEADFFNDGLVESRLGAVLAPTRGGGFVVDSVESGGPAAKAGLKRGMLVRGFDRTEFPDVVSLAKYLHAQGKGQEVEAGVVVDQRTPLGVYRQTVSVPVALR
jgi:S1-C subfamily serine protease